MFAETDFHKLGGRQMFLIAGGRIYHAANSGEAEGDFLSLCNVSFPLMSAETLPELEGRYRRRNREEMEKFKARQRGEMVESQINRLREEIRRKGDIVFFFRKICSVYDSRFKLKPAEEDQRESSEETGQRGAIKNEEGIFGGILRYDCAVINGRVYPLHPAEETVFARIGSINYELRTASGLADEVEKEFQRQLEEELKAETISDFERSKSSEERISALERELGSLETMDGIRKFAHSYEFGDVGYDSSAGLVYWLIPPHYNETSEKRYEDGQSAVTLELKKGELGSVVKFADRADRDSPFAIHSHTNCYGDATKMPSFEEGSSNSDEDKMYMLRTCAEEVFREGKFFEPPQTSSSEESYY